jgi:hypothetical protein
MTCSLILLVRSPVEQWRTDSRAFEDMSKRHAMRLSGLRASGALDGLVAARPIFKDAF